MKKSLSFLLILVFESFVKAQILNIYNYNIGFTENKGQIVDEFSNKNDDVKFIYNYNGFKIILRANSFSYQVCSGNKEFDIAECGSLNYKNSKSFKKDNNKIHRVDIKFRFANSNPEVFTKEQFWSYTNFYTQKKSILSVRSYKKIVYKNIYPKIDIEFYAGEKPKYNFILHPGANLQDIKMVYEGMDKITTDSLGNLNVFIPQGIISESIPLCFWEENKKRVKVKYQVNENTISFKSKSHDKNRTLVIDPVPIMILGRYCIGTSSVGNGVVTDSKDNIIITGITESPNVATSGAFQTSPPLNGNNEVFLAKFTSQGELIWATYYGGSNYDSGNDITVDSKDNILIVGVTNSPSNIATTGAYQVTNYLEDAFISKFDSTGILLWGTYYGGDNNDEGFGIAVDHEDNILIVGGTKSPNNIASLGAFQPTFNNQAGFLTKFDPSGIKQWGTYYGQGNTVCTGIDVDSKNNIVFTGSTSSTSLIASSGAFQMDFGGGTDALVAKFAPGGSRMWSTYYGGKNYENDLSPESYGIKIDSKDNIIIAGSTNSTNGIASPGAYKAVSEDIDTYIAKFDSNGNLQWGTYYGGEGRDAANRVTIDRYDNILFTGITYSKQGIATSCAHQDTLADVGGSYYGDAFIAKFSASGNIVWGSYYGNASVDQGIGITINSINEALITGFTDGGKKYVNMLSPNYYNTLGQSVFLAEFSERTLTTPAIKTNGAITFCPNDSVILTASTGKKYFWTNGDTTESVIIKQEGSYYAIVTDTNGCPIETAPIVISFVRPTVTTSNGFSKFCSGGNVTLTASSANSYLWSTGDTTRSIVVTDGGNYTVTVKDTGCISTSNPFQITEVFPPDVFLGVDTTLCNGREKQITLNIQNASFLWSTGLTDSTININSAGNYWVQVKVTPCSTVKDSIQINYISEIDYFVPNVITPNHDGKNDAFELANIVPGTTVNIYNSWGGLIYESENYQNDWEGSNITDGIYYYHVSNSKTCVKEYKGWLQVIR